jgi:hypothetical protein
VGHLLEAIGVQRLPDVADTEDALDGRGERAIHRRHPAWSNGAGPSWRRPSVATRARTTA